MYIEAEFYTIDQVIRGYVDTPGERLSDYLNVKTESSMIVSDVQVNRLLDLGKAPPIRLPDARMEKRSILFAYPVEKDITAKSIYRKTIRQIYKVVVLVPNFQLIGSIHLAEKFEIRHVLLSRQDDFVPLTDATAIYSLYPALSIWRSTIIFNKNQMVLISEHVPTENPFTTQATNSQTTK